MDNQARKILGAILALLTILGTLAGCSQTADKAEDPLKSVPAEADTQDTNEAEVNRPPLVEPEMKEEPSTIVEAGAIINGDFEQYYDETWNIPGWTVDFSQWGEGDDSCSAALTTEPDNDGNTTQKLSLYNGMSDPVEFTVTQAVPNCTGGEYVVTVFFEGGPDGTATGAQLCVNGDAVELGNYLGWKNWKTVASNSFSVNDGDSITIEVRGTMKSKDWLDIDDVKLIPLDEYNADS